MENKTSKYFKYAIGEIILVVIGILIALQINNWNEDRKERQVEQKILKEIANNIISDTVAFKRAIRNIKLYENYNKAVLAHLINKTPLTDSLKFNYANLLGGGGTTFTTMGLENLKSEGVRVIKNDSLRSNIVSLYKQLDAMRNWADVFAVTTDEYQRMHISRIKMLDPWRKAEPYNLATLQTDYEFIEVIKFNILKHETQASRFESGYEKLISTLNFITSEIKAHN